MTPEQRYTKALSIPVGEWAKLERVSCVNFFNGEILSIYFDDMMIRVDVFEKGIAAAPSLKVETPQQREELREPKKKLKSVVAAFIDSYAPEVESCGLPLIEWPSEEDRMWIEQNPETSITGAGFPPHHFLHIKPGIRYKIDISKE